MTKNSYNKPDIYSTNKAVGSAVTLPASNNSAIAVNLETTLQGISKAAMAHQRSAEHIQLLAVSKTKPISDIIAAYQLGQRHFGENYVQESVEKIQNLSDFSDLVWHFIGPLQSNKSKFVAEYFDWLHSLDRIKLAKRLNDQRSVYKLPLNVCVQVNIDDEQSKSGIAYNEVIDFIDSLSGFDRICCRGLMTIPKANASEQQQRQSFAKMRDLFQLCTERFDTVDTLSMGMSNDLDIAIEYGATMVRIGTAIFGKRQSKQDNKKA